MDNQLPKEWHEVCIFIQDQLKQTFPNEPFFRNQCKRAGVMLDLYFKNKGVKRQLVSGWINKVGDEKTSTRGHVWLLISHQGKTFVLDPTLMQFNEYLGLECPPVVFGAKKQVYQDYAYVQDLYGTYRYDKRDFSWAIQTIEKYMASPKEVIS